MYNCTYIYIYIYIYNIYIYTYNYHMIANIQELIHGAPIGKPAANTARVTALYIDDNGTEIKFSRV